MRQGQRTPNYFLVAVVTTVVIALLTMLAFTKTVPFIPKYEVKAIFTTSNQLRTGSPVRIAGVDVGKVTGQERGPGETTIVSMQIGDKGRPVHSDAKVRIRPRLFLEGGFYMELQPGSPSAPELDDGGTIPPGQTRTPVQFHTILSEFEKPTRENLRTLIRELGKGLRGGGAQSLGQATRNLAPALRDIAVVAEAARGTEQHDLSGVIRSGSKVTAALASRERELADLVTNLRVTADALSANDGALSASVRELDGVLREAPPALSAIDRALPPTERFIALARPGLRISPPILAGGAELLRQLEAAARPAELPALLGLARPLFRDLPPFLQRLDRLVRRLRPVSDCIRDRVVPGLNTTVSDGGLSTGKRVWQEFGSGLVGLAGGAQSFDGNGAWNRYLVGVGSTIVSTGSVPGVGTLFGGADRPILGSRPVYLGPGVSLTPLYRPDLDCASQPAPNYGARASTAAATRSRPAPATPPRLDRRYLKRLFDLGERRR